MHRVALVALIVSSWLAALAAQPQQQVRGQVVNRDGAPQQCQVDFYTPDTRRAYSLNTDYKGYFLLTTRPESDRTRFRSRQ